MYNDVNLYSDDNHKYFANRKLPYERKKIMNKNSPARSIAMSCVKKSIWIIMFTAALVIVCALLSLINPIVYKKIIDEIIPSKSINALIIPLIVMVFVPWFLVFLSSIKNYLLSVLSTRITTGLRSECFNKCLRAKQSSIENIPSAQVADRIAKECGKIGEVYLTKDLASFVQEFVSLLTILLAMLFFDVKLTFLCCLAFPVSFLLTKVVAKRSKKIDRQLIDHLEGGYVFLTGALRKIKTIKLKNGYSVENTKWLNWLNEYNKIKQKATVVHNANRFLIGDFIINIIYGVLFFVAGVMVIQGELTLGELVIFISYVPKVYSSLRNVLNIKISTEVISNSFDKVDEIIELEQEQQSGDSVKAIYSIDLRNIEFKYPRGDFNFADFNLHIKRGDKIGIVGTSGVGKSTIFELISLLYTPQKGEILINGVNAHNYSIDSIRGRVSVVTQNVDLFNDSILNNIIYPFNHVEKEELEKVVNLVSLSEFIDRLPDGLNTYVGEDGNLLSGGEKQRISIANSLIHDSDVILLDEFTAALDTDVERKLIEAIMNLPDKTVLMISHRIYNVMLCDRILVINGGKITEVGEPKRLLADPQSSFHMLYSQMIY